MWSLVLVLLSYLDPTLGATEELLEAPGEEGADGIFYHLLNGTACAKESSTESPSGPGYWYQVSDGLQLVGTTHDGEGRMVGCSIQDESMVVKAFTHVCRLGLRAPGQPGRFGARSGRGERLPGVAETRNACQAFLQRGRYAAGGAQKKLRRSKRGFTYPGTVWCGVGNNADSYDHLGEFAETDKCCRTHDSCPHVIHPFSYTYGYRNYRWHTISHCECDRAMQDCLRSVNDTASKVVGQAFFNVIQVPCFEFQTEERCIERYWYGWCKKYERVAVAVPRDPILYEFGGDLIDAALTYPPAWEEEATPTSSPRTHTPSSRAATVTPPPLPTEQPTLEDVISIAEDLLKVMATIGQGSTTSTTEASKTETFINKKKKKKKQQKNKKNKKKGKGLKKKKKLLCKTKEQNITPQSSENTKEQAKVILNEMDKTRVDVTFNLLENELDLGGKEKTFNDVMNDEPVREEPVAHIAITTKTMEDVFKERPTAFPVRSTSQPWRSKKQRRKNSKEKKRGRKKPRTDKVQDPAELFY